MNDDVARMTAYNMLQQYFGWADALRLLYDREFADVCARAGVGRSNAVETEETRNQVYQSVNRAETRRLGATMCHWFAALWVVCEGWEILELQDAGIDDALRSPTANVLKRLRHGVCHFQRNPHDARFNDFFSNAAHIDAVLSLHGRLAAFLAAHPFAPSRAK